MYTIREVKPTDLFSVISIAYKTLPEHYTPAIFNHFYESFPQGFLIVESHHKIIGFLVGIMLQEKKAKILMLAILESYRRKAIGTQLLQKFLTYCSTNKIRIVELEVRITNSSALAFYQKNSFIIIEKIKGFYQNKEDAYCMQRKLRAY